MKLELAPAALVRASAWPVEVLDVFGADLDAAPEAGAFERAHRQAVDRERAALWERTASDPRFMRALAFASPSLVTRVGLFAARRAERNKRVRHLETSLYRYLSRAASRTTPAGLWAGVGFGNLGREDRVTPRASRHAVAPDLAPFAAALRALGERQPYRDRARWRLNPSLRPGPEGDFTFLVRLPDGRLERRRLESSAGLASMLERLARLGARTLGELAAGGGVDRATADALADGGVLVGGFVLPAWFQSPWGALDAAGELLANGERATWLATLVRLRENAAELEARLDAIDLPELLRLFERARGAVAEMSKGLGVEVEAPSVPFRVDLALPFEIVFGAERRERLLATLAAYHGEWLEGASPIAAVRAARRSALARRLAQSALPLGASFPAELADPTEPTRLRPLENEPAPRRTANLEDAARAPWGSLFARIGGDAVTSVFGVDDNPARPFARYGDLLGERHALAVWLAERVAELRRDNGVCIGDLAVPFEARPNVLARPEIGAIRIEPWGTDGPDLASAELRSERDAIFCWVPGVGRVAVVSLSSAGVGDDPVAAQLLFTGFEEGVAPGFRAAAMSSSSETEEPAHAGRWALSTGALVRENRTRLDGALLASLLGRRGAARFAAWRALGKRFGWPRHVTVSIDGATPLLLDPSSPLAFEAAFEGAAGARTVLVEDADVSAWLAGPSGRHVADLTIPFARAPHAFSKLEP